MMPDKKYKIRSVRQPGFWRAGRQWPFEGKVVSAGDLTDKEWAIIRAERSLVVEEITEDKTPSAEAEEAKPKGKGK